LLKGKNKQDLYCGTMTFCKMTLSWLDWQYWSTFLWVSSGLYYKSFTIVIYDCNDSSQYYKTMIMIASCAPNLALAIASVVNYDLKWCHNLKHHLLTIVMYLWYRPLEIIQLGQKLDELLAYNCYDNILKVKFAWPKKQGANFEACIMKHFPDVIQSVA